MRLPKLSPLQSRLAASLIASAILVLLYFTLSSPHFAYAAEVDSIQHEDHNHRLLNIPILDTLLEDTIEHDTDEGEEEADSLESIYDPDFLGVDRGIVGRQTNTNELMQLTNNVVVKTNVEQGRLLSYVFTNASLWGPLSPSTPGLPQAPLVVGSDNVDVRKEDDDLVGRSIIEERQLGTGQNRTLYITVTTCLQPSPKSNGTTAAPPQLKVYVSTSRNNTTPGPTQSTTRQTVVTLDKGFGQFALNATGDVFVGVYGENTTDYKDVWNAHIAASIDAPFHVWLNNSDPNLFMTDSDSASALLVTDNLVSQDVNSTELYDKWMNLAPPFVIFASPVNDKNIKGLERSYCAWDSFAAMGASTPGKVSPNQIQSGMTSRGVDNLPKEQFYLGGLKPGTQYQAVLAMKGNSTSDADGTVGGGGQVYPAMTFSTMQGKSIDEC
jgi:calcium channel MID1